jgi:hypothetical protein
MNKFLDIFFLAFHSLLTLFNMFGWAWKKTRLANLITLVLTFLAWFGLGIFYGIGYCPLTDWHFRILRNLGETDLPNSYITYVIHRISGISVPEKLIDIFTVAIFFLSLSVSAWLNIRDRGKKNK